MAGRLTGWDKGQAYILRCFGEHPGGNGRDCPYMDSRRCVFCKHQVAVFEKLARLEDGGETTAEAETGLGNAAVWLHVVAVVALVLGYVLGLLYALGR